MSAGDPEEEAQALTSGRLRPLHFCADCENLAQTETSQRGRASELGISSILISSFIMCLRLASFQERLEIASKQQKRINGDNKEGKNAAVATKQAD